MKGFDDPLEDTDMLCGYGGDEAADVWMGCAERAAYRLRYRDLPYPRYFCVRHYHSFAKDTDFEEAKWLGDDYD